MKLSEREKAIMPTRTWVRFACLDNFVKNMRYEPTIPSYDFLGKTNLNSEDYSFRSPQTRRQWAENYDIFRKEER